MEKPLRIAINAQIPSGRGAGGVETVIRFLASINRYGGNEEFVFIGHPTDADWVGPLLGERQKLVRAPRPRGTGSERSEKLKSMLGAMRPVARRLKEVISPSQRRTASLPISDGFFESLGCDVIHFPYQDYVQCNGVPTIYNPHDLQHLHHPEFFAAEELERRESIYPAACRSASYVAVATQFVRADVIAHYGTRPDRIVVIPWAPPPVAPDELSGGEADALLEKYDCPRGPFILYPAMTWEHKNHLRLLEAVHLLREREGLRVNLVCTGHKNDFYPRIERRLRELNLAAQIQFTGMVEVKELTAFYKLAEFVVVPTLFEAASAPIFEAWQHGTAVACSSATSLPEQAGDAALLFDPHAVDAIAEAVKRLWEDKDLRVSYRDRGIARLRDFSHERTSRRYLALYKQAAERPLSIEEIELLN